MAERRFEVALPEEVLEALNWQDAEVPRRVRETLVMELLRLDRLSEEQAAQVLGLERYEEVVGQGEGRPGAAEVVDSPWIGRRTVTNTAILEAVPTSLHPGEREALALAEEVGASILIDELRGRRFAAERGIPAFGSLAVLSEAKTRGHIPQVGPFIWHFWMQGTGSTKTSFARFSKRLGRATSRVRLLWLTLLELEKENVSKAGGVISKDIFAFLGGRRAAAIGQRCDRIFLEVSWR